MAYTQGYALGWYSVAPSGLRDSRFTSMVAIIPEFSIEIEACAVASNVPSR
jgi:hypothetical protein